MLYSNAPSVRVVDIQPQLLATRSPAPAAAFLSHSNQGTVANTQVTVNLDSAVPAFMSGGTPFFAGGQPVLPSGQSQTITATFLATRGYFEFDLLVTYIAGGKQYQITVRKPTEGTFQLASKTADYRTYRTVYLGVSPNQFEIADKSQECGLFPSSRGC
ncbi:MAG: hypothetical protein ACRDOI_17140 [Trebonia sp.]